MIAVCSSGKSFGALGSYLTEPRNGVDRAAWTSTRNLAVDDPDVVARVMQATANQNVRVEKPVYHIAVSFHPEDVVTRQQMEHVADRLLQELGLEKHQALIVAHDDRRHAHFHVMVNRIDPETTRAWDRWQDYPIMQRVMREQERELGTRQVEGHLYEHDGHRIPEQAQVSHGEHQLASRTGTEPLLDRIKEHVAELRAAETWGDLEARLAEYGFSAERKGQGLVFTDGRTEVKASRVHRELSFGKLEQRYGEYEVAHPGRDVDREMPSTREPLTTHIRTTREPSIGAGEPAPSAFHQPQGPDLAREAAKLVRGLSQLRAIENEIDEARESSLRDQTRLRRLEEAIGRAEGTGDRFNEALERVYVRPDEARERFDQLVKTEGIARVARLLEHHPEAFGPLCPTEHRAFFGLITKTEYETARGHAGATAVRAYEARQADIELRASVDDISRRVEARPGDYAHTVERLGDRIRDAEAHLGKLAEMREALPSRGELARELRDTVREFSLADLNRFAGLVTDRQYGFALKIANPERDIARERGMVYNRGFIVLPTCDEAAFARDQQRESRRTYLGAPGHRGPSDRGHTTQWSLATPLQRSKRSYATDCRSAARDGGTGARRATRRNPYRSVENGVLQLAPKSGWSELKRWGFSTRDLPILSAGHSITIV